MTILVCRVAWMPFYRSKKEEASGGGSYVEEGNVPYEALNFLPVKGEYFGYVSVRGNININKLGAKSDDEKISGVLVVFCASDPKSGDFLVIGWYKNATVYRKWIKRPGEKNPRYVRFTSTEAVIVEESLREFLMPGSRDNPREPFGGIGQVPIWYGLNQQSAKGFRDSLGKYIQGERINNQPEKTVIESKKRSLSKKLERRGSNRKFIHKKGFKCEACKWSIEEDEQEIWGSSFELHHLVPFSELKENEKHSVSPDDFAVLCASCHRAIHCSNYISAVSRFAKEYIGSV